MRTMIAVLAGVILAGCGPSAEEVAQRDAKIKQEDEWIAMCVAATGVKKNPDPDNGYATRRSRYPDQISASYNDYNGERHECIIRNLMRDEGRQPTISVKNF